MNIVAHDKFQEIIDEANKPDSAIRMQAVLLDGDQLGQKTATVVSQSQLATKLGLLQPSQLTSSTKVAGEGETPLFTKPAEQEVAQITWEVIRNMENQPHAVPTVDHLKKPEIQVAIVKAVEEQRHPVQLALEGVAEKPDIKAVVANQKRIRARSCAAISGTSLGSSMRRCKSITGRTRLVTRSRPARATRS